MNKEFKKASVFGYLIAGILIFISIQNFSVSSGKAAVPTSTLQSEAAALEAQFNKMGYTVLYGEADLFDSSNCEPTAPWMMTFHNCGGNNPAAPYVIPYIPTRPDEYTDPYYSSVVSKVTSSGQTVSLSYRLTPEEGIVILMNLPPQGAYWGYQSYLFDRDKSLVPVLDPEKYMSIVSPDPGRVTLAASIGNSINDASVALQENMPIASIWDQQAVLSTSGNQAFHTDLKNALAAIGQSTANLFLEPIGSAPQSASQPSASRVHLGLDSTDDVLQGLMRYALPNDGAYPGAGEAWRQNISQNMIVMRVFSSSKPVVPYTNPVLDSRTAISEEALTPLLNELVSAVQIQFAAPAGLSNTSLFPMPLVGPLCIDAGLTCMGDSQDTDAYRVGQISTLETGDVAVIVGVDHTATGNANYVSIAVDDQPTESGAVGISKTGPGAGFSGGSLQSASAVINPAPLSRALQNQLSKFYVAVLARNCEALQPQLQKACTNIPSQISLPQYPVAIPLGDTVSLIERAYLKPGDLRGADPTKLLSPVVFKWGY